MDCVCLGVFLFVTLPPATNSHFRGDVTLGDTSMGQGTTALVARGVGSLALCARFPSRSTDVLGGKLNLFLVFFFPFSLNLAGV